MKHQKILIVVTITLYSILAVIALVLFRTVFANEVTSYLAPLQNNKAFSTPINDLSSKQLSKFSAGRSLFKKLWIAAPTATKASDGLGPLYNARSCFQCHINAGRGQVPDTGKRAVSLFMRLSIPPQNDTEKALLQEHKLNVIAEPTYGTQLQNFAVTGLASEGELQISFNDISINLVDDETVVLHKPSYQIDNLQYGELHPETLMSPRMAPQLVGMGLLEKISEQDILQFSDLNDADNNGISGKPNYVWSRENQKVMLGRFGYKAGVATLNEQNQSAFFGDLGLSTPLFPKPWGDCSKNQPVCRSAPHGDDATQGHLEVPQKATDAVLFYTRNLSIPSQRHVNDPMVIKGQQLFNQLGCSHCHRPSYQLGTQTISPYTDMLLHDMGDGLADNRPEGEATGKEWRTAPLWGIGLTETINGHNYYLHDGRARTLQQAILWHGGEAQNASSRYSRLNKRSRQILLKFLESL